MRLITDRVPVQIFAAFAIEEDAEQCTNVEHVYALANDGTMWRAHGDGWMQLPDLPQPDHAK